MNVAKKLSEAFDGSLRISYSGGADAHNIKNIVQAGIWPVTVATTLLKPGGYERFAQLAQCFEGQRGQAFTRVNVKALDDLLAKAQDDAHYARLDPKPSNARTTRPCLDGLLHGTVQPDLSHPSGYPGLYGPRRRREI